MLRSILELARGIRPDDLSEQARAHRTAGLKDFDGLTFMARIGIEKGKPKKDGSGENFPDKNIIASVITPDRKGWHPNDAVPSFNGGGNGAGAAATSSVPANTSPSNPTTPVTGIAKPDWAK